MSSGYLVLIIYDLYCKCLESVFVKIMEVLVMWKLVEPSRRCENTSAHLAFLMEMYRKLRVHRMSSELRLDLNISQG